MRKPLPSQAKLRDSFPATHADQIRAFELEVKSPLPADYRRFLLSLNGGCFHDCHLPAIGDSVRNVYGLDCPFYWADLRKTRNACSHWMPTWLLPIADGAGGNHYCLSLDSTSYGYVYHVQAECLFTDPESPAEPTFVATCFDAFLKCVKLDISLIRSECKDEGVPFAAEIGDLRWLQRAAGRSPSVLFEITSDGDSLLHRAVRRCQLEVAAWLISVGHDLNGRDTRSNTPLFMAAFLDSIDAVRLLVTSGCDMTASNDEGHIALVEAVELGAVRCAIELWQALSKTPHAERYRKIVRERSGANEDLMAFLVPLVDRL